MEEGLGWGCDWKKTAEEKSVDWIPFWPWLMRNQTASDSFLRPHSDRKQVNITSRLQTPPDSPQPPPGAVNDWNNTSTGDADWYWRADWSSEGSRVGFCFVSWRVWGGGVRKILTGRWVRYKSAQVVRASPRGSLQEICCGFPPGRFPAARWERASWTFAGKKKKH